MNMWLQDIESRGQLGFNCGSLKSHEDAEKFARKTYHTAIERARFVAGWNAALRSNKPKSTLPRR